ncbi:3-oxoacyl-[acyl-carrier-protein] synthase III C-terminal domain-containing protein [Sporosarcina sp. 6E9]|uniref:3-oxoacyl-[acyl-carrier-protein] synthase III C-terminal domain-containing protein n=1 Tax=Sporosarcina sp. 6E9 TaxID=2819235 RepID=UPI001B30B7D2|nr:3-oxoacyl-[acyl-carrier-protein] synthase III C-terminal domain-containing protein [Sporosarcina sp. 6E9]
MNIGIRALETFIPKNRQSVEDVLRENECTEMEIKLFKRIHKLNQVPIVNEGQRLEETLSIPLKKLFKSSKKNKIELVLYTHTIIPQVPYNYELIYRVLKQFELEKVTYYGISHFNCASFFTGLEMANDFLQKSPDDCEVLIISGDQTNFMTESRYLQKSSIIGDSSAAMILGKNVESRQILSINTLIDAKFHAGIYANKKEVNEFNQVYIERISKLIDGTLEKCNLSLKDIDWIIPHNVNITTWRKIAKEKQFDFNKIMTHLIEKIGHTYCTDAQLNLEYAESEGLLKKGDLCLLIGVGLGAFFGASLIKI